MTGQLSLTAPCVVAMCRRCIEESSPSPAGRTSNARFLIGGRLSKLTGDVSVPDRIGLLESGAARPRAASSANTKTSDHCLNTELATGMGC